MNSYAKAHITGLKEAIRIVETNQPSTWDLCGCGTEHDARIQGEIDVCEEIIEEILELIRKMEG